MTYDGLCAAVDAHYAEGDRGDRLFAAVRGLAMYRLGDDDAAQDVLLVVFSRIDSYRGVGRFHAFVNRIISDHRARLIQQTVEQRKAGNPGDELAIHPGRFSPDFGSIGDPFVRRVADLLCQGYTQNEIARRLRARPETLRWRLFRHRARQAKLLRVA